MSMAHLPKCVEPWSASMNLFDLMKQIVEVPMEPCGVCGTLVLPWQLHDYGWCNTRTCSHCSDQIEEDWQTYKSNEKN